MPFSDTSYNLRIELDQHNCELPAKTLEDFERGLQPLRQPLKKFPVCDLYITVTFEPRSHVYRVKTALVLSGKTLVVGDVDERPYPPFERCVRKLVRRLLAYEANLSATPERAKRQKGTHQEVIPEQEPDFDALQKAIEEGDYRAFRTATLVYEEPIRMRVGRWVQRYPDIAGRIGDDLTIADMVEEVFLNAFERFQQRPEGVRFGQWLEHLIDPSIKLLAQHPDEELENVNLARTLREM